MTVGDNERACVIRIGGRHCEHDRKGRVRVRAGTLKARMGTGIAPRGGCEALSGAELTLNV